MCCSARNWAGKKLLCPHCGKKRSHVISKNDLFFVIRDNYPVTKHHTLIIPIRHTSSVFDLNEHELIELHRILAEQRLSLIKLDDTITGFNVGFNSGVDAGQTINHAHVHLIPRRKGDMKDPAGGVRGVIPEKQKY
jgi:diadenosine tetraphosphate (Ap4A) HIT family hydrolase